MIHFGSLALHDPSSPCRRRSLSYLKVLEASNFQLPPGTLGGLLGLACGNRFQSRRQNHKCVWPRGAQGEPAECPLWTCRTGVCRTYPLPGRKAARSERRWPQAERTQIFGRLYELQAGSCLYVTTAVKAASHFGTAYVAAAAEACSRLVGVCWDLWCTHSTYMFNEACLGSLMRFGFIGFRSLHLVPFSSFSPSHTSVPLFSFMSSCLHVFHHPSFRLRAHWSRP